MPPSGPNASDPRRPAQRRRPRPPARADPFEQLDSLGDEPTDPHHPHHAGHPHQTGSAGDSHFALDSLPDLTQQSDPQSAPPRRDAPRPSQRSQPPKPQPGTGVGTPPADAQAGSSAGAAGAYKLLHKLGGGGMGEVWVAQQHRPRRRVAIKLIRTDMSGGSIERRFELESEALARLQHEGIAQVYDAGYDKKRKRPYYVMELVEGRQLNRWAAEDAPNLGRRLRVIIKLCEAVAHAHARGVIHRDLKPANVIVTDEGRPKILDFGLARLADDNGARATVATQPGQLLGTLAYMSPEQADGDIDKLDGRTDIYSVGVIAYELLTGNLPIDVRGKTHYGAIKAIIEQSPPSLVGQDAHFNDDLDTIIRRALSKRREGRYNGAGEMAAALRHWRDVHLAPGGGPAMNVGSSGGIANSLRSAFTAFSSRGPDTSTLAERAASHRRGRRLLGTMVALVLLLGLVVAGVWFDLLPGRPKLVALLDRTGILPPEPAEPALTTDANDDPATDPPPRVIVETLGGNGIPPPADRGSRADASKQRVRAAANAASEAGRRLAQFVPGYVWRPDTSAKESDAIGADAQAIERSDEQRAAIEALANRHEAARAQLANRPSDAGAAALQYEAIAAALERSLERVESGDYLAVERAGGVVDQLLALTAADLDKIDSSRARAAAAEAALAELREGLDPLFAPEAQAVADRTVAAADDEALAALAARASAAEAARRFDRAADAVEAQMAYLAPFIESHRAADAAVAELPAGEARDGFQATLAQANARYADGDARAASRDWEALAGEAGEALAAAQLADKARRELEQAWRGVEDAIELAREDEAAFAAELADELAALPPASPRRLATEGLAGALGGGFEQIAQLAEAGRQQGDVKRLGESPIEVAAAAGALMDWARARRRMAQMLEGAGVALPDDDVAAWMTQPRTLLAFAAAARKQADAALQQEQEAIANAFQAAAASAKEASDALVAAGGAEAAGVPDDAAVAKAVRNRDFAKLQEWAGVATALRERATLLGQANDADPETGRRPLHEAALLPGDPGVAEVQKWLDAGARPLEPDKDERTPFGLALEAGNAEAAALLAEAGGLPPFFEESNQPILLLAHTAESIELVASIYAKNNVSVRNRRFGRSGGTALHMLIDNARFRRLPLAEQAAAARALVEAGVDPAAQDNAGRTPADYAQRRSLPELTAELRRLAEASR